MIEALQRLKSLLKQFEERHGRLAVLTGAGISAESGIPTFRGPEGYWTVGSTEHRPEQMATHAMFTKDPWGVWSWYLYRRTVCRKASPNPGHLGVARMETLLGDRFRLITQNVDGLHLRAGNTEARTFQIHGNLHFMRCARTCTAALFPIPPELPDKERNEPIAPEQRSALVCPRCGGLARPHVLWFDECYNELFYQASSAIEWASRCDLLLVVGTAGATTLPMRIGEIVSTRPEAILIDVNPHPNPFRALAAAHTHGIVLEGPSGRMIPEFLSAWESIR